MPQRQAGPRGILYFHLEVFAMEKPMPFPLFVEVLDGFRALHKCTPAELRSALDSEHNGYRYGKISHYLSKLEADPNFSIRFAPIPRSTR